MTHVLAFWGPADSQDRGWASGLWWRLC